MSFTATFKSQLSAAGVILGGTGASKQGSGELRVNEDFAAATVDQLVNVASIVAQQKAFGLLASVDMTIKTNNAGAPTDTINLLAGEEIVWHDGLASVFPNPFTADITDLFVTSVLAGNLQIYILEDATP